MTTPISQPPRAICREEPICWGRVEPSGAVLVSFFTKVWATATGPGRVEGLVSFKQSQHSHHTAMNSRMDSTDSQR